MAIDILNNQTGNRNFLSPVGFKFSLAKAPKVDFYSNFANIPGIKLGTAIYNRYGKNIPIPGDKMEFEDLTLRFLVDENLENYLEIWNWMTGLGFPESLEQYKELKDSSNLSNYDIKQNLYEISDGTLQILSSNYTPNANIIFSDLFPVSLSSLNFDATSEDVTYFTAEVSFNYTYFRIVPNAL